MRRAFHPEALLEFEEPSSSTSNALERVNHEQARRTRMARVFPNEASLLRLVTALPAGRSDEWETGKTYLNLEGRNPSST